MAEKACRQRVFTSNSSIVTELGTAYGSNKKLLLQTDLVL